MMWSLESLGTHSHQHRPVRTYAECLLAPVADPCDLNPCGDNAICEVVDNEARCSCEEGYFVPDGYLPSDDFTNNGFYICVPIGG